MRRATILTIVPVQTPSLGYGMAWLEKICQNITLRYAEHYMPCGKREEYAGKRSKTRRLLYLVSLKQEQIRFESTVFLASFIELML